MKTHTLEHVMVKKPITEHPAFYSPKKDWRVKPAYVMGGYSDERTGRWMPEEVVPEDRSQWRKEEDGMSLADFWDSKTGSFKDGSPFPAGLETFLSVERKPMTTITKTKSATETTKQITDLLARIDKAVAILKFIRTPKPIGKLLRASIKARKVRG
jgi:hypothetical protein